jgi:hypothetical protein
MKIESTREEKIEALKGWETRRKDMDSKIAQLEDLLGISPESVFLDAVRRIQEQDRIMTSLIVGDNDEWLDWYCYENSFGADGMTINIGGRESLATNVEELLEAIEA